MPNSLESSLAALRRSLASEQPPRDVVVKTPSVGRSKPHVVAAATNSTEACQLALSRQINLLRERNGKGPLLDALAGTLITEARSLGEPMKIANELESIATELRAGIKPIGTRGVTGNLWATHPLNDGVHAQ